MSYPRPPGVYFERTDAPPWSVEESRTDIAGFIGATERGPLHFPVQVHSWNQFQSRFGRDQLSYAYLPDSVRGFFNNGGQTAWIVRVGNPESKNFRPHINLVNEERETVYTIVAKDPGLSGALISLRIVPTRGSRFHLFVQFDGETMEVWRDLDSKPGQERSVTKLINGWDSESTLHEPRTSINERGSVLIEAVYPPKILSGRASQIVSLQSDSQSNSAQGTPMQLQGFLDWEPASSHGDSQFVNCRSVFHRMTTEHFTGSEGNRWGLSAFNELDEPSILAIPDLVWRPESIVRKAPKISSCIKPIKRPEIPDESQSRTPFDFAASRIEDNEVLCVQLALLNHCAQTRDRFAVLDCPGNLTPQKATEWAKRLQSYIGQFGALYYPWIATPSNSSSVRWLPASGHVAGLFARVDRDQGVQKSPANEVLAEAMGTKTQFDADDRGQLNQQGVNTIVPSASRGVRIMGGRTLVPPDDNNFRPWQFVCVRRLVMMIEESLDQSTQWLVHGENSLRTRLDVERVVRNFLMRQWRKGRLDGESPEDAFRIVCNETNNPVSVLEQAKIVCDIAIKPPAPAEFVFIRIGGQDGSQGTMDFGGQNV